MNKSTYISGLSALILIMELVSFILLCYAVDRLARIEPASLETIPYSVEASAEVVHNIQPLEGSAEIDSYAETISDFFGLDPYIIKALIFYESRYDKMAYNESTGATGLMQVDPKWHHDRMERLEVYTLFDPYGNILVGCDYLNELLEQTGDIKLALMMYNMNHTTAKNLYGKGIVSEYARNILTRAEKLRNGEITSAEEA